MFQKMQELKNIEKMLSRVSSQIKNQTRKIEKNTNKFPWPWILVGAGVSLLVSGALILGWAMGRRQSGPVQVSITETEKPEAIPEPEEIEEDPAEEEN